MKFGLTAKADDPRRVKVANHVAQFLNGKAELVVDEELVNVMQDKVAFAPLRTMKCDVMVCIGGDGTILHALQHNSAPVFGINMGELGFLTEIEPIELTDGLNRVLARDFFIEHRLKIASSLNGKRMPDAANEVAVKTKRLAKILQFELAWGDREVMRVRGDGMILATPTGSTSYAMSAGGPIVDPRMDCFALVPLAAFSLSSRPMVLPPDTVMQMRLMQRDKEAVIVVDGQFETEMQEGDQLNLYASEERAKFVRFRQQFYHRLKSRLS
ncbi:MAG TPA: NAD(+)/NADH kinase [Candidatus Thermoplasmatota archaeon]|nr:NAD(+)/NADH kinase [Candidatus Thermoplasmatota archaeon]